MVEDTGAEQQEAFDDDEYEPLPLRERMVEVNATIKIKPKNKGAQPYAIPLFTETKICRGGEVFLRLQNALEGKTFNNVLEGIVGVQGEEAEDF